jgi:N-acetylmuramoyl-L-alanine amidase
MNLVTDIIVHHSASVYGCSNEIDDWHRDRGWDEIGYHWVICNGVLEPGAEYNLLFDGMLERGRRSDQQGAHWKDGNAHSCGVCMIGSGEYTDFQLMKLSELLMVLVERYNVSAGKIRGHYEVDHGKPECPMIDMARVRQKVARREFVWNQADAWRTIEQ